MLLYLSDYLEVTLARHVVHQWKTWKWSLISSESHNLNVTTKELPIGSVEFHSSEEHFVMGPGALKIIPLALLLVSDVVKGRK